MTDARLNSRAQPGETHTLNRDELSANGGAARALRIKKVNTSQAPRMPASLHKEDFMSRSEQGSPEEVIFLRLPEVKTATGLSKSSLYALIRANSFPAPVQLGPRTVAWVKAEVKQWADERVLASRSANAHTGNKKMPQRAISRPWIPSKKWA
jgi:prophage regulatory protein